MLASAKKLAGSGAGRGRPALSDLRRATSTAYYALFHQILRHGAFAFLPGGVENEIADVSRWFTHAGIKDACTVVLQADSGKPLPQIKKDSRTSVMALRSAGGGRVSPQLVTIADSFISLQEARHSADYDGNYDPVRAVTLNHVQDADAALRECWSLWRAATSPRSHRQADAAAYRVFLRLALLHSGAPRAR